MACNAAAFVYCEGSPCRSSSLTCLLSQPPHLSLTEVKTHSLAEKIFKALAAVFLLIPLIGWTVAIILNQVDKHRTKVLREEINQSRWKAIERVAKTFESVQFQEGEDSDFDEKFTLLKTLIFSSPSDKNEALQNSLKVQQVITDLFSHPQYDKIAGTEDLRIKLIGQLALSIRTDARGGDAFKRFGRQLTEPFLVGGVGKKNYTYNELGETLAKGFNASVSITMDFIPDILLWGIVHPLSMLEAIKGTGLFGYDPVKDFNPYLTGNVNVAGWDYKLGSSSSENTVRFAFGPGPGISSDRLLEVELEHFKNFGGIHLQHSLEHPQELGEIKRMERLKEIEERYPGKFRLLMTPLNGSAWKMDEEFLLWESPTQFIKLYKNYACMGSPTIAFDKALPKAYHRISGRDLQQSNGFYVGKDAMTEEQFEGAFDAAAKIFSNDLTLGNPYILELGEKDLRGKVLLGKGLQVFTQALIAMGALTKLMTEEGDGAASNPMYFGQACREDIDRGVVINIATKLLFYLCQEKEITKNDLDQIVGETLGRAELVLRRRILIDKFEGLISFIYLIGSHPGGEIKKGIQSYLESFFPKFDQVSLSCNQVGTP